MQHHDDDAYETEAEAELTDVMAGARITLDELAVELAGVELRLRRLARAAETPATPVELADTIDFLRSTATRLRETGEQTGLLARIVNGDAPLARTFTSGDPWGAAARGTDREDFGGPALVPSQRRLLHLARTAQLGGSTEKSAKTTTYADAMGDVGRGWESKAATVRRLRERNRAVAVEVLRLPCERCDAGPGKQCRTKNGWTSDKAHVQRQREAEATVDQRLGFLDINPVHVAEV
ncbi:hypothetical protein QIS99_28690 [Streptomyces sp. B-S-A8]|uniref:DNA-binding phage zinc finger domain-containing protein n=1 Tax=Streptomyces solicavernae TaxID=3043614 RepID=A0ABT6S0C6_9ACTN|nr:hypothetical protein [Streptomyces sp. B-S-A8]MDI3390138.1 hypothetical protein [Streptomyces sp. B-S-A8]